MAKLLVLHDQHGDRYFLYHHDKDLETIALKIVKERDTEELFCDLTAKEKKLLKKAVKESNGFAAWLLLQERRGWEYEGFDLDETENE